MHAIIITRVKQIVNLFIQKNTFAADKKRRVWRQKYFYAVYSALQTIDLRREIM